MISPEQLDELQRDVDMANGSAVVVNRIPLLALLAEAREANRLRAGLAGMRDDVMARRFLTIPQWLVIEKLDALLTPTGQPAPDAAPAAEPNWLPTGDNDHPSVFEPPPAPEAEPYEGRSKRIGPQVQARIAAIQRGDYAFADEARGDGPPRTQ